MGIAGMSSRTVCVDGIDMQFRDSAVSWANLLFQQYINGELKDRMLVDYFDALRLRSENALLKTFDIKPGPVTPRQADNVDAHFQEAMNRIFAHLLRTV